MSDSDTKKNEDAPLGISTEVMDRAERKALKAKAKAEAKAKRSEPTQQEIEAALASSKMAAAQKAKRKKMFKIGGAVIGLALLVWAYNYLFSPYKGGMTFGICKTYLELNVHFPQELKLSTVEDFGQYIRIWYTQLDAFGQYRMENIQCHFRADENTGAALEKILINRREIDPAKVASFNKIIPVILQSEIDLTIPYPLPDSLQNLKIETHLFRKPIL